MCDRTAASTELPAQEEKLQPRALCTSVSLFEAHVLAVVFILSGTLVFVGGMLDSFHMKTEGLVASFVLDMPDPTRKYGLVTLATAITDANPGDLGAIALRSVLMLFAFIIPLVVMLAFLMLWVIPLRKSSQQALLTACRSLYACSAYDVFVLALIVSRNEMGLLSEYLVYYDNVAVACNLVKDYLQDECMRIKVEYEPGFLVLLAGGIAAYLVPSKALRICQDCLDGLGRHVGSQCSESDLEDSTEFASQVTG